MATVGQVYYNVIDKNTGSCLSSGPSIFREGTPGELVKRYGANQFNKIGIQAKPGTIVVMNDTKTIMIGQTGIYELDDDIVITSLYFNKPPKYIKDIEQSNEAIAEGIAKIKAAEQKQQNALSQLGTEPDKSNEEAFKSYWSQYNNIQSTFIKEYNEGLSLFQTGNNGIYRLPNPDNIQAPENYDDLYDVIIDFIYE